ncbi:MAG: hypothetical protein AAB390_01570 [Patescibacteria group bacterium]
MSITIPLYSLLFLYFIFLLIFAFFSVVNVYHIASSGTLTSASFAITFLVGALAIFTFYFTFALLVDVRWTQPLILFDTSWFSNILPV